MSRRSRIRARRRHFQARDRALALGLDLRKATTWDEGRLARHLPWWTYSPPYTPMPIDPNDAAFADFLMGLPPVYVSHRIVNAGDLARDIRARLGMP